MSRNNTTSLQADNVEDIDYINNLLMIEAGVTKKRKIGQLKNDNFYLYNSKIYNLQEQLLENFMDDDNKKHENVEKVLFLTTELLEK